MTFFVPGKLPSLNDAFLLARRSGYLAAGARVRGIERPADPFNDRAREVKHAIALAALAAGWSASARATYRRLSCWVVGHRWDRDAAGWVLKLAGDALFGPHGDKGVRPSVVVLTPDDDLPPGCPVAGPGLFVSVLQLED